MPAGPYTRTDWRVTGKVFYRIGWFGRIIVQVEEEMLSGKAEPFGETKLSRWKLRRRDAKATDLFALSRIEQGN